MTPSRQTVLLDFIRASLAEAGIAPTYDAMAAHLGLRSKGHIRIILEDIERLGLIRLHKDRNRSIELVGFNLGVLSRCSVRELEDIIIHARALLAVKSRKAAA